MRFLHTSDLHLGKKLHMADLAEDQEHMLSALLSAAADCDAVLLAGDCYNRAQPSPDVITRFGRFLTALAALSKPVFVCRGNHDGEAQIAYASELLALGGVHATGLFDGSVASHTLYDSFGPVHVYSLPYIKPAQARRAYNDASIETYDDAVSAALAHVRLNTAERNVLITHQFVAGALPGESEETLSVGGTDRVSASLFDAFDYVALGHIHRKQTMGGRIRYSGAPLCYSFDEAGQSKSFTVAELGPKGAPVRIMEIPYAPLRPLMRVTGTLSECMAMPPSLCYVQVSLTDDRMPLDADSALRATFPNLLNRRLANAGPGEAVSMDFERAESLSPMEHFLAFFRSQNGDREPNERQMALMERALSEGGDVE